MFEDLNEQIASFILSPADPTFNYKIHIDYTRHNGLYEYNKMALPIWVHLTTKKAIKPEDAFAILNFTLAPFHILASNLE